MPALDGFNYFISLSDGERNVLLLFLRSELFVEMYVVIALLWMVFFFCFYFEDGATNKRVGECNLTKRKWIFNRLEAAMLTHNMTNKEMVKPVAATVRSKQKLM